MEEFTHNFKIQVGEDFNYDGVIEFNVDGKVSYKADETQRIQLEDMQKIQELFAVMKRIFDKFGRIRNIKFTEK